MFDFQQVIDNVCLWACPNWVREDEPDILFGLRLMAHTAIRCCGLSSYCLSFVRSPVSSLSSIKTCSCTLSLVEWETSAFISPDLWLRIFQSDYIIWKKNAAALLRTKVPGVDELIDAWHGLAQIIIDDTVIDE